MGYSISKGEVTAGPFPEGMNNKLRDHAIPDNTVRNIVNGDVDSAGKVRRRKGFTKVYDGLGVKGGFRRYFIEGLDLCYLNDDSTKTVIYSGITGTEYAYYYFNGTVYFSDGIVNKKIIGLEVSPWGSPVPTAPVLAQINGSFGKGVYLASYSWVDANGIESGGSDIASIELFSSGGIKFNNLPSLVENAVALRIYLSTPNGKLMYHVADTTDTDYSIMAGSYDEGAPAESLFMAAPPAATIIRFYNGRAYVVDNYGNVWYSEPFSFDHFQLSQSYLMFPSQVTIMEPVKSGIFFATNDETFFYEGNPESGFNITKKFNYGGLKGTGQMFNTSGNVTWMSQRGVIVGSKDGSCKNIQEDNVATESGTSGSLFIREQDGNKQIISTINNPTTSPLVATSFIEAEIIRRT